SISVKGNHSPACEAGGENASPRRWRSRAWGNRLAISKSLRRQRKTLSPGCTFHLSPTSWAATVLDTVPQARLRRRLGLALSPPAFAGWLTHHRDTENTERFQITGRVVPAVELLSRLCGRRTQLLPKFEALDFSGGRVR